LITLFAILTLVGIRIALQARTPFRRLLAAGLASVLGIQAWIIMAGNARLIPLTGVTLPFVSYGGSSLLSSFIALALLTTVSRDEQTVESGVAVRRSQSLGSVMAVPIRRLSLVLLLAFGGLAIVSGYWALIRYDALRGRDDNPRLVEAEQQVHRGPILDRDGVVLARSLPSETGVQQRNYLTPTIPAVGYYSLKHGVGGVEASGDAVLRGLEDQSNWDRILDELLHRQPDGQGLTLTIDAGLQREVAGILAEKSAVVDSSGQTEFKGAIVLMDVANGEIPAMVSQPTYDPNMLDADWEQLESNPDAPLLNRATQGLYQPGGVLQLVVLAAALEVDAVEPDALVDDPVAPVMIDRQSLGCAHMPRGSTLADAVSSGCPGPLADLGATLGAQRLEMAFRQWGLDSPPVLEIPTEAGEVNVADPRLAATGQEALTVTPLHLARVAAALGNSGAMPTAQLVLQTESTAGKWQPHHPSPAVPIISPDLAERLLTFLRPSEDEQILGHSSLALAGADRPSHVWFIGLAPSQAPQYAVVVLLEHGGAESQDAAEQIGHDALIAALDLVP
jgi:cell division protein FtsI/penicillin-binding protein 2